MKRNCLDALRLIFTCMAMITLMTCSGGKDTVVEKPSAYSVGGIGPGGGIVFHVTENGAHGMEVSAEDLTGLYSWSADNMSYVMDTVALPPTIGAGVDNTNRIVNKDVSASGAAMACRNYRGGGKDDWFLPSKDELNAVWKNLVADAGGGNSGKAGFQDKAYWSSSECHPDSAWTQNFFKGGQYYVEKSEKHLVRAIRTF
jgi:hypothetical protein